MSTVYFIISKQMFGERRILFLRFHRVPRYIAGNVLLKQLVNRNTI